MAAVKKSSDPLEALRVAPPAPEQDAPPPSPEAFAPPEGPSLEEEKASVRVASVRQHPLVERYRVTETKQVHAKGNTIRLVKGETIGPDTHGPDLIAILLDTGAPLEEI